MQIISYSNAVDNDIAFEDMLVKVLKKYDEYDIDYSNEENDYISVDELENRLRDRFGGNNTEPSILDSIFQGKDRITFTLPESYKNTDPTQCDWYYSVAMVLKDNGYSIVDYIKGICEKDGRQFKIGKILTRYDANKALINGFANSQIRNASKNDMVLTLSRNKIDVITMSTNKGWSSCMNLATGSMNCHLDYDISYETLIAYFHKKEDKNIENPTARFLLKRYYYVESRVYYLYQTEKSVYGSQPYNISKVGKFLEEFINSSLEKPDTDPCVYKICQGLYNDSMSENLIYMKYGWDFYNKEHIELFHPNDYKGDLEELKSQLKSHKNKNILLHNRYLYKYADLIFDDESMQYMIDNNISICDVMYNAFYGEKIDIETLKLLSKYEDLTSPDKLTFLSNIYGGTLTIEDGILKDEACIKIFNLRKEVGKKVFLTENEYKIIEKIRCFNSLNSSLELSKVYTFINTDEEYAKVSIHSLYSNDLDNLRKYLSKEEIIKFIDKCRIFPYGLRSYRRNFVMEYKPEIFERLSSIGSAEIMI